MDLNIPGERKCFHCMKSFDSVQTRIFHEEKLCHLKNVISCSQCCESSIFDDENEAFDHVTNNHDFSELDFFREPTEAFHCLNCCLIFHDEISYWIHYYRRHPKYAKETLCTVINFEESVLPMRRKYVPTYEIHVFVHFPQIVIIEKGILTLLKILTSSNKHSKLDNSNS